MNFSFSSIKAYLQCPKKFYRQFILREPVKSEAMDLGIAVHTALEKKLKNNLTNDKVRDVYKVLSLNSEFDILKEGLKILSDKTLDLVFSAFKDRNIESEISLQYPYKDTEHNIKGKLDVLIEQEDKIVIVDFKTGKKRGKAGYWFDWLQQKIYSLLVEMKYKRENKKLKPIQAVFWFVRNNDILTFDNIQEYNTRTKLFIEKQAKTILEELEKDNPISFIPKWNIFCNACSFKSECPLMLYKKKKGRVKSEEKIYK